MSGLPPFLRVEYKIDFRVGDKGVSDGRFEVTSENRENLWRFCRAYCKPLGIAPYLDEVDFQTKTRLATGFSGRMQKGSHCRLKEVKVRTVRAALGGVNANIALDTGRQPLHQHGSNDKYTLLLQHMLKGF